VDTVAAPFGKAMCLQNMQGEEKFCMPLSKQHGFVKGTQLPPDLQSRARGHVCCT